MRTPLIALWLGVLAMVPATAQDFNFDLIEEVPVYEAIMDLPNSRIVMDYASSEIENPGVDSVWQTMDVKRVDLVFTRYPKEYDKWIIGAVDLSLARLQAARDLDSTLFAEGVELHFMIQTDCDSRDAAKEMFHGLVVYYDEPSPLLTMEEEVAPETMEKLDYRIKQVAEIIYQEDELEDSTALTILQRHSDWDQMLVVMDWTGSMYDYGASVLLWHRLNLHRASVRRFVFFNDGDDTPNYEKKIGETGGIYLLETESIDSLLLTMNKVRRGGNGGDGPENDVEALKAGIEHFEGYEQVVLIADNRSDVRDLEMAKELNKPIRVVLCGVTDSKPIHEEYLTLAYQTGGSVHTIEEDIAELAQIVEGTKVEIGGNYYMLEDGTFSYQGRKYD